MSALLEARNVSKRFGGIEALSDVSFSIPRGQIFGLIGPNGAGKTTLFNLLTGLAPLDRGSFALDGRDLAGLKPDRVAARGIGRTFQNIRLFANLSALENVMIGRHVRTRAGVLGAVLRNPATRAEEAGIERRAAELLDYVGIRSRANEAAGSLPYGDQRRLEIARALATDPVLLALDEPAAGMNASETAELRTLLGRIRCGRRHAAPHRARHASRHERVRSRARPRLRAAHRRRPAGGGAARPEGCRSLPGRR